MIKITDNYEVKSCCIFCEKEVQPLLHQYEHGDHVVWVCSGNYYCVCSDCAEAVEKYETQEDSSDFNDYYNLGEI